MKSFIQFFSLITLLLLSSSAYANEHTDAHKKAQKATSAIRKCFKNCGMSKDELYKIALFIETELPKQVETNRVYYFSRTKTKLARTIEVDPHTKKIFIHLQRHNVPELGRGARKNVTYSILYSTTKPRKVAHSHTTYPNENEAQAMSDLKGVPGLCKIIAVLSDSRNTLSNCYSFITKYYPRGDFSHYVQKHSNSFKFKDRLRFCRDIIHGIERMHNKGYAHRDLGLRNFFVTRKRKHVHLVVADFGRAVSGGNTSEKGAQGGYSLCAPEGLKPHLLKGDDYLRTDIFALGCVFYKILYNKKPCWMQARKLRNTHVSLHTRHKRFIHRIEQYRKQRLKELKKTGKLKKKRFSPERVEAIILKMINPNPHARPTASVVRSLLQ
ncbi:MAG: protein kinase family protein [Verrucomicrobia bacterium]|nr:protein kinase family protein [Verrucomicrobiota bacterium]